MTSHISLTNALSPDECDRLISLIAAHHLKDAGLVRGTTAHNIRRAEIAWLDDIPEASWVLERMISLTAQANREAFQFDLSDFGESPQVARYTAEREGHFDWHSDIGAGNWAAKRKLTIVVQLSDPTSYEGGTLELRPDSNITQAPRTRGTATIFPSFTLHRVTPLIAGTRWSLTLWSHGPAFR
ncbi:2OG-Fe(II) oxygenase [Cypionkella psychrotolerans]|uniref:2OG-Fe(II) oxygenase n=1 Tax=Cypionkella psychrotolerans TaxID=1678131 RepID=UPI0006B63EEE|nr:2OG-Fe(II) oxygenase [Cypionkella psychrotolerans]